MWDHFDKIKDDNDMVKAAKCKYCKRELKADTKDHGTSSLMRHFDVCMHNPHTLAKDPKQATLQVTQGQGVGTWRFDPDDLKEAFAEIVIQDELPFCFGKKPGFRKFVSKAYLCFKPPSRRTCSRYTVRLFFREKAKLKKFFKDSCRRVCLTTDCWTSQRLGGYMTVTTSFIDESWSLHKKIIGFFLVKGHKGDDIGKNLVRCLTDWGLERVMTVTVDNASNNYGGISYLRRQLNKTHIANGKFLHMSCGEHIVNLIVQDGIKEVDVSVKHVRDVVRYIRNGSSRVGKFKEIAEEEKMNNKTSLKIDVPTRWNSTFLMLKAANIYEKVFIRLAEEDILYIDHLFEENGGFGCPEESDWENAKKLEVFLEHFHDLTIRVSATLHVTSNRFVHEIGEVCLLIQAWINSPDTLQATMGKRMKDKFDKYWGLWHTKEQDTNDREKEKGGNGRGKEKEKENVNLLIFVAGVIDPRYKLSLFTNAIVDEIFGVEKGQQVWEVLKTCVHDLFDEYRDLYGPTKVPNQVHEPRPSKGGGGALLTDVIRKKLKMNNGSSMNVKSKLEKYLAKDTEDIESNVDILAWWKANAARFPILARLARDVLAIPISTVASESTFSTSGRILDDFRTSLTPFMLETLVCAQDWLRMGTPILTFKKIWRSWRCTTLMYFLPSFFM